MNSKFTLLARRLAAFLVVAGPALIPAYADDKSSQSGDASAALSVSQVLQKLDAAGYRQIDKIQLKRGNYEVRTTGRDGERIKLYVNAQTGSILGRPDVHKEDDEDSGSMMQKLMGNCNQRRCRDDLVSAPDATTPGKP